MQILINPTTVAFIIARTEFQILPSMTTPQAITAAFEASEIYRQDQHDEREVESIVLISKSPGWLLALETKVKD